ncbi:hypothetical protein GGS20DRAFT_586593 [Poronia punctata]|nr:hypothetical protein GGS20DRAFT_586593 [Poronia punctata]
MFEIVGVPGTAVKWFDLICAVMQHVQNNSSVPIADVDALSWAWDGTGLSWIYDAGDILGTSRWSTLFQHFHLIRRNYSLIGPATTSLVLLADLQAFFSPGGQGYNPQLRLRGQTDGDETTEGGSEPEDQNEEETTLQRREHVNGVGPSGPSVTRWEQVNGEQSVQQLQEDFARLAFRPRPGQVNPERDLTAQHHEQPNGVGPSEPHGGQPNGVGPSERRWEQANGVWPSEQHRGQPNGVGPSGPRWEQANGVGPSERRWEQANGVWPSEPHRGQPNGVGPSGPRWEQVNGRHAAQQRQEPMNEEQTTRLRRRYQMQVVYGRDRSPHRLYSHVEV